VNITAMPLEELTAVIWIRIGTAEAKRFMKHGKKTEVRKRIRFFV
jgi:hypothetical protein